MSPASPRRIALRRPVALIGFMGAGKSTVGRIVAEGLGIAFADLDELIAEVTGLSIAEIFRSSGEDTFREIESACLDHVAENARSLVLAAGGGAPLREHNRRTLRERFRTFYLAVPFSEVVERTSGDPSRPLRSRSVEELKALYESRLQIYEQCGERIEAAGKSSREVARLVAARLLGRKEGSPR